MQNAAAQPPAEGDQRGVYHAVEEEKIRARKGDEQKTTKMSEDPPITTTLYYSLLKTRCAQPTAGDDPGKRKSRVGTLISRNPSSRLAPGSHADEGGTKSAAEVVNRCAVAAALWGVVTARKAPALKIEDVEGESSKCLSSGNPTGVVRVGGEIGTQEKL